MGARGCPSNGPCGATRAGLEGRETLTCHGQLPHQCLEITRIYHLILRLVMIRTFCDCYAMQPNLYPSRL